jgi:hypothetical protein
MRGHVTTTRIFKVFSIHRYRRQTHRETGKRKVTNYWFRVPRQNIIMFIGVMKPMEVHRDLLHLRRQRIFLNTMAKDGFRNERNV